MHCNGANSYLFVNGTEIHKFKAKDSEIVAKPLCPEETFQKTFQETGLSEYVYDFSADYDAIAVDHYKIVY